MREPGTARSAAEKKFVDEARFDETVRTFFRERLEFYLKDVRGYAYDVVKAVLAADAEDVVDALARAEAVTKVRPSADFESISIAFKRIKNILRQAAEAGKNPAEAIDAGALQEEAEKLLAHADPADCYGGGKAARGAGLPGSAAGDRKAAAGDRQVFRQSNGHGRREAPAREPAGAAADTAEGILNNCRFFRNRDRRQGIGPGAPNFSICKLGLKDSYMATSTLPEVEANRQESKKTATKYVYFFGGGKADGNGKMKDELGGKGAGLAEMTNAGLPVPPGFTIQTEACREYMRSGGVSKEVDRQMEEALARLEALQGQKLGAGENPLLVSVRSGAKFSMPGMMDTILNLGLNDKSVESLAKLSNNPRFAADSYRRLIQMFGNVVLDIEKSAFDEVFDAKKKQKKAKLDTELDAKALKEVIAEYKKVVKKHAKRDFPQDPHEQLVMARDAVFRSWQNDRAKHYRRINNIDDMLGTAVNVQAMVFGNLGETSGTGVGFTRNPATGAKEFYGEFLMNAQGEDVVSGVRTPVPILELKKIMPEVYDQLREITTRLEKHYRDMQDFEFTIQDGKLYMLQTRNGKRTGLAAVRVAIQMVEEGLITKEEAIFRVEPNQLYDFLVPRLDEKTTKIEVLATGLPASPGAAVGQIVFTADEAVEKAGHWTKKNPVILVRAETTPEDIQGMEVAAGILTSRGGMTSHAAVVTRGMGKCCVAGAGDIAWTKRNARCG